MLRGSQTDDATVAVTAKFQAACMRIASSVDPLRQRAKPSSSPKPNISTLPGKLYCVWSDAKISEVSMTVPTAPIRDSLQPRNRKPRKMISSTTGAATTVVNQKRSNPVTLLIAAAYSLVITSDWSSDGAAIVHTCEVMQHVVVANAASRGQRLACRTDVSILRLVVDEVLARECAVFTR